MSTKKNTRKKNPSVKTRSKTVVESTETPAVALHSTSTQVQVQEVELSPSNSVQKARTAHNKEGKKTSPLLLLKNPKAQSILISVISSTISIVAILWFAFGFIPMVYDQTSNAQEASAISSKKAADQKIQEEKDNNQKRIAEEDLRLKFVNQKALLTTNYGDINITFLDKNAPKTVENFIRLTDRKLYKDVQFHRLVKENGFAILQGGDYEFQNGSGGKSAFGEPIADELWEVAPILDANRVITNEPKLRGGTGYLNYNKERNFITIPKGYLAMANSGANTAGSQFFITLKDTELPASYTVFASVDTANFSVLDKIFNEVDTTNNAAGTAKDKPTKDVILIQANIIS